MEAAKQAQVAFFLTGRIIGSQLKQCEPGMRPALLARFGDLTQLRYDFPLVLVDSPTIAESVVSLTSAVDGAIRRTAESPQAGRICLHAYRFEQEVRRLASSQPEAKLSELSQMASERLKSEGDEFAASVRAIVEALPLDGIVVDCTPRLPFRLFEHLWRAAQQRKIRRAAQDIERLTMRLEEILQVETLHTEAGWTPDKLRASVGKSFESAFDFDRLSSFAGKAAAEPALTPSRRRRIEWLLGVLKAQRFFVVESSDKNGQAAYDYRFTDPFGALEAFQSRLPQAVELSKAMAIANLEIEGLYVEASHDPVFEHFGTKGLDENDLARFPDYLVCGDLANLAGAGTAALMDLLAAGLPMKVVVKTDDLVETSLPGAASSLLGMRCRELAASAISLTSAFVMQAAAANLYQLRDRLVRGLSYPGPSLFSVYSGGDGAALPAYLMAAAATESRAFPSFTYDPAAGSDWASRFSIDSNPQVEQPWPNYTLSYEGPAQERIQDKTAFTLAEFAACDPRFAEHFAIMDQSSWSELLQPTDKCPIDLTAAIPDSVPFVTMVDADNRISRAVVHKQVFRQALRARDMWLSLRELAGVDNSHVRTALTESDRRWESRLAQVERASVEVPATAPPIVEAPSRLEEPLASDAAMAPRSDDAYIETARCTSCNECIQVNNRMFAYNENKQAYIADKGAGTYRQLVEAAEGCQVSIIHPGKPWNANEPGLQELLERAAPFV